MKRATKTVKFNIVDIVILLLIAAVVSYVLITTFGIKEDVRVNDTVELSFTLTDNYEYVSLVSVGDKIYLSGAAAELGTVSEVLTDDASRSATIKVEAFFPHDAQVYSKGDIPVLRGESYELKTLNFKGFADLTGIRTLTKATLKNSEDK